MKVKAKEEFQLYRCDVLDLDLKDFRALQAGKIVDLAKSKVEEYPQLYEEIKGKDDGNNK